MRLKTVLIFFICCFNLLVVLQFFSHFILHPFARQVWSARTLYMQHGYRWCIEIFFSYHKFLQPSAIRMLRERRPERGEFLTKRTKRLIHDLTESCFSLRTCSRTPRGRFSISIVLTKLYFNVYADSASIGKQCHGRRKSWIICRWISRF